MTIKIGAIIKKLRTENNTTQETLATAIGVTPQAISRWEAEGGYPDIELLPGIAHFFSVSIDELLGYQISERENKLNEIKKEMKQLAKVGTLQQRIDFARVALSQYPNNIEIKENLAICLYHLYNDTKNEKVLPEAEILAAYVAEHCNEDDIRYDAINTLIGIYSATQNIEKSVETINRLVPMKYSREIAKAQGIGDGNNLRYKQELIHQLANYLGEAITDLVLDNELPNVPSTWDNKIQMLQTANQLYPLIYGENLLFFHWRIAFNHWLISTYQAAQGKTEEVLSSLEKMCHHTLLHHQSLSDNHSKCYSSNLVNQIVCEQPYRDITEHSPCFYMLERLQEKRYDFIRKEPRFIAIETSLKEYAT